MRYGLILCALLLVGCGQKGALYLPSTQVDQAVSKAVPSTTSAKADNLAKAESNHSVLQ